ncbi:mob1/phocein family domain-containing protein [Trichoderma breve]|uniref:Mob1/phocein family domain-containing protein n=1 Tax=Trichoderma breve TaxID=2034170 RepID=A0A9W9EDY9_9HYPO|nr:mob1/phocein family domain-containing protein [Trichoderma breve]KAJ4864971.1 mob1/phocein family domain-containing protein [Trichoderma breve]
MSLAPSSPRLPSPPPPAEIQIGPNSPSGGPAATLATTEMEQSHLDASSSRRIHPGTKAADMAAGPPLVPLSELDSPFQLQEHLAALHYHSTASGTQPLTRASALQLAQPPPGIDRTLWLYELCRFLISQCNSLIVGFLFDTPPCSASTCPEMRASEWQFLCAVHEQPKSCCAIDYCCHTLDWAANVVSDQKIFPSRFVVVNDIHSKNVGVKSLVNVFRRLHRIFAHAWFQHRSVFWAVEGQTGLYVFFKTVCDLYDLLPAENYKLPPEAEGLEAPPEFDVMANRAPPPQILKPQASQPSGGELEDDGSHGSVNRTNTRRHIRSSPSTGSSVTTVMEAEEEDADGVSRRLRNMHLAAPDVLEEEPEVTEVPVIVEQSDEAGTVSDLSDVSQQTGVSESIVEITDDDVTSVIDTSDAHNTTEQEEETTAAAADAEHAAEPSGEETAAQDQQPTAAETAPAADVEKEGAQGDEK